MTEEELVARLKSSDKAAFSSLYDNYSNALYGVVMKIVRTDPPAEDVIQDAFIKIWKSLANYDSKKGTLFTWMLNVTRNTAIDRIRSSEYQKSKTSFDIDSHLGTADRTSNHNPTMDHIGVNDLVNKLKSEHKEIIELAYFQGYTQTEIADKLNIPLGTVKTRVKLAMTHLKELTN